MINYFFISSPLHFFIATNLAISHKNDTNIAIFMSKNKKTALQYSHASNKFKNIFQHTYDLTIGNIGKKMVDRKQSFNNIKTIILSYPPDSIYTGNDRRVEFQYAMFKASRINKNVKGIYMDDGAISYLGHKSLAKLSHRYIDPLLKKIFYGFWWKPPLTTGSSNWISQAYLAYPKYAHPLLKGKKIKSINREIFSNEEFNQLNHFLTESYTELNDIDFSNIKAVLCLPFESFYLNNNEFIIKIKSYLDTQYKANEVAFKPHPRSKNTTLLNEIFTESIALPRTLGMELLLSKLDKQTCVFGDFSSTLLTTKWLRPELETQAFELKLSYQPELKSLFQNLNIKFITI